MTLRRSSRAPPPVHSNSSSSLSSRDRTTRSNNKASSPHKSASPGSLSSEEGDDAARHRQSEEPHTRRRTRAQDIEEDEAAKMDEDIGDDEEETTRCICGYQEYPGPPSDDEDLAVGSDLQAEDVGGLFIQCDKCKVWQHGGCVGIMEEKAVPENYFCEECRKDLHKLLSSPKGYVIIFHLYSNSSRLVATVGEHRCSLQPFEWGGIADAAMQAPPAPMETLCSVGFPDCWITC